jgi:hypothetical protein
VPCSLPASPCKDDGNPCTVEACASGFCTSVPLTLAMGPGSDPCITIVCADGVSTTTIHDGAACGVGLTCVGKVCTGCQVDLDCGKSDECQTPTCEPMSKSCNHGYEALGTKVMNAKLPGDLAGDCMATICDGSGKTLLFADATDVPDDGENCTDGHCVDGKPVQAPSAAGTPCADGVTFCSANQSCLPCAIDANCAAGKTCYMGNECVNCTDAAKNGDETDIDCGGACGGTCKDGKACKGNGDCANKLCIAGLCVGCFDGVHNNGEAGIDCGGSCMAKCNNGTPCMTVGDCNSGQCVDGFCCNMTCTGVCKACDVSAKEGTCTDVLKGHDDVDSMCSGTMTCKNGSCMSDGGKKHFGESCLTGLECFSGSCSVQTFTCQ